MSIERSEYFENTETPVNKSPEGKNNEAPGNRGQERLAENKAAQEQEKLAKIEDASRNYLSKAPAPVVRPNSESYSPEANNLVYVGIQAAEESFKENMERGKKSGISPESEKQIYDLYRNLAETFEKKIRDLQNDPKNIEDPKKFQDALNEALKQFQEDLVQVSQEANGIVNAPGAQKNAMDAKQQEQQNAEIASKERLRFGKLMKEMLDGENARKMIERKNQLAKAEAENWMAEAGKAKNGLISYVGWTPETDSAAQKKNG